MASKLRLFIRTLNFNFFRFTRLTAEKLMKMKEKRGEGMLDLLLPLNQISKLFY